MVEFSKHFKKRKDKFQGFLFFFATAAYSRLLFYNKNNDLPYFLSYF